LPTWKGIHSALEDNLGKNGVCKFRRKLMHKIDPRS
jgi:hypothetical protein